MKVLQKEKENEKLSNQESLGHLGSCPWRIIRLCGR
jgi:hypothetical protein